jgi:hypothetical protein
MTNEKIAEIKAWCQAVTTMKREVLDEQKFITNALIYVPILLDALEAEKAEANRLEHEIIELERYVARITNENLAREHQIRVDRNRWRQCAEALNKRVDELEAGRFDTDSASRRKLKEKAAERKKEIERLQVLWRVLDKDRAVAIERAMTAEAEVDRLKVRIEILEKAFM